MVVEMTLLNSNLGHYRLSGGRGHLVDAIATDCESCAVWFGLFGLYDAHELTISNICVAILWDIVLSYELDRVCRVFDAAAHTTRQSSKLIS